MQKDIPKPVIVVTIIVAVVLAVFIGKSLMAGPPQPSKEEKAKFTPSWIDPVTNKPRNPGGAPQTSGGAPNTSGGASGGQ